MAFEYQNWSRREDALQNRLRSFVREGVWEPLAPIPCSSELLERLQCAPGELESALEQLEGEGFLEKTLSGYQVGAHLPEEKNWLLVIPNEARQHNVFISSLEEELVSLKPHWVNLETIPEEMGSSADLNTRHREGLLGGIMLPTSGARRWLKQYTGMPVVCLGVVTDRPRTYHIHLDNVELTRLMARAMKTMGVNDFVHFSSFTSLKGKSVVYQELDRQTKILGLRCDAHHRFGFRTWDHSTQRAVTRVLMNQKEGEVPEGIMVGDDNILTAVSEVLSEYPEAVRPKVVAHGNLPELTRSKIPCQRVVFDVRELARLFWKVALHPEEQREVQVLKPKDLGYRVAKADGKDWPGETEGG